MLASDWPRVGGQGGGARSSTISSVSVEKNVFFASVNYTQAQYYILTFTLTYRYRIVPFWKSLGGYLVESLINFLYVDCTSLKYYSCTFTLASLSVNYSWKRDFNEPFYCPCDLLSAPKNRVLLNIFQNISQQIFRKVFETYFLKEKAGTNVHALCFTKRFSRGSSHLNWVFCWKYHKLCVQLAAKIHKVKVENMIN